MKPLYWDNEPIPKAELTPEVRFDGDQYDVPGIFNAVPPPIVDINELGEIILAIFHKKLPAVPKPAPSDALPLTVMSLKRSYVSNNIAFASLLNPPYLFDITKWLSFL